MILEDLNISERMKRTAYAVSAAFAAAVLADFLFYDKSAGGAAFAAFFAFLFFIRLAFAFFSGEFLKKFAAVFCAVSIFSVFYAFTFSAFVCAFVSLIFMGLVSKEKSLPFWAAIPGFFISVLSEPIALFLFLKNYGRFGEMRGRRVFVWAVSIALALAVAAVFLLFFGIASPQIAAFAASFFDALASFLKMFTDIPRGIFYAAIFFLTLPFFSMMTYPDLEESAVSSAESFRENVRVPEVSPYIVAAVLAIFCAVFLPQNFLDLAYMFGGMQLPEGTTYSKYAIGGAVALMFAVMLSGAILFLYSSVDRGDQNWKAPRIVAMFWIFQIFLICVAASARLAAYVCAYDMTELRIAGFFFFALSAFGLGAAVVKIHKGKSVWWLVNICATASAVAILTWSLAGADELSARYNVTRYLSGKTKEIDLQYLKTLGTAALPSYEKLYAEKSRLSEADAKEVSETLVSLRKFESVRNSDWRMTTLQDILILKKQN